MSVTSGSSQYTFSWMRGSFYYIIILLHYLYFAALYSPARYRVNKFLNRTLCSIDSILPHHKPQDFLGHNISIAPSFSIIHKCYIHKIPDMNIGYLAAVRNTYFQENTLTFLNIAISERSIFFSERSVKFLDFVCILFESLCAHLFAYIWGFLRFSTFQKVQHFPALPFDKYPNIS